MRNFVTFLFLILFIISGTRANEPIKRDTLRIGDILPKLLFTTDGGKTLTTDSLIGKTTMLLFFATWCGPCRAELPHVQKEIWEKYKNNNKFSLLIIGREHTLAELQKFKKDNKFTFPIVPDSGRIIFSHFAQQLIPRTYVIDRYGKIIRSTIGFEKREFSQTKKLLKEELKKN